MRRLLLSFVLSIACVGAAHAQALPLSTIDSLRQAGAFQEALETINTAQTGRPPAVALLWREALTEVDIGEQRSGDAQAQQYAKALETAQQALAADSSNAHAHLALAIAQGRVALNAGTGERIRRSRAVKTHVDRAIALDSTLAPAYHVRARWNREVADLGFFSRAIVRTVYGGLPEASFEQAVRDFKTAIRLEDKIIHHVELARTYMKMDEEDPARKHLNIALQMPVKDPDDPRHKEDARKLLDDV
ncbi:tetratricopeptide repeat protein [Salisaeta longa]|uniref:hypothetical protein n=1 Tax=Salisaeta longa TaxID=503170 RepID=UPI0003B5BA3F|nr:hypothetical protein [Salisaeta longa]